MSRQRTPHEETLYRRRRDTSEVLKQLNTGELWHPLSEETYRGMLLRTLDEIEYEIDGGDWLPDLEPWGG